MKFVSENPAVAAQLREGRLQAMMKVWQDVRETMQQTESANAQVDAALSAAREAFEKCTATLASCEDARVRDAAYTKLCNGVLEICEKARASAAERRDVSQYNKR